MTEGESLLYQLLEARGLQSGIHFWYDKNILAKLPNLGTIPDFYIEKDTIKLLIEVKDLEREGSFKRGRSNRVQMSTPEQYQKALEGPFRKAKTQLKPYLVQLQIPTLILFFDFKGTHLLSRHILETLFGEPTFDIIHHPLTGRGEGPFMHRGSGQQMNQQAGTHVSAVGALGFDLFNHLAACIIGEESKAQPRVRILQNPYAIVPAKFDIFNADDDEIYA